MSEETKKEIKVLEDTVSRLKYQYEKATTVIEKQKFRREISAMQARIQKIRKEDINS